MFNICVSVTSHVGRDTQSRINRERERIALTMASRRYISLPGPGNKALREGYRLPHEPLHIRSSSTPFNAFNGPSLLTETAFSLFFSLSLFPFRASSTTPLSSSRFSPFPREFFASARSFFSARIIRSFSPLMSGNYCVSTANDQWRSMIASLSRAEGPRVHALREPATICSRAKQSWTGGRSAR